MQAVRISLIEIKIPLNNATNPKETPTIACFEKLLINLNWISTSFL